MSKITIILGGENSCQSIPLGRVGENEVTEVEFDYTLWAEEYGSGALTLTVKRPGETEKYLVALEAEGTKATWVLELADLALEGFGEAEATYNAGDKIKKSKTFETIIINSMDGDPGDPPDPMESWLEELRRLTAQTIENAQAAAGSAEEAQESAAAAAESAAEAEAAVVHAPKIEDGVWYVWDTTAEAYVSTGISATGPEGPRGETGPAGPVGPIGPVGPTGEDGITPDFEIGTVGTLPAGSDATATITGTPANPVLNLGIPQGDPGEVTQAEFDALEAEIFNTSETTDSGVYMKRLTDDGELAGQKIMYENLGVIGGSLVWNQLVKNGNFESAENWSVYGATLSVNNNIGNVTYRTGTNSHSIGQKIDTDFIVGHKYVIGFSFNDNGNTSFVTARFGSSIVLETILTSGAGEIQRYEIIYQINALPNLNYLYFYFQTGNDGKIFSLSDIVVIDLTALFGETIANYIYSLEQSTAGAGVAWFKKYFPEDYYQYSAPILQSVNASAHIMKDANDETVGIYALDADLELRGMPKLDTDNNLVYDGDTYEADGTVTRKYGLVDLGTLTWVSYTHAAYGQYFYANFTGIKYAGSWASIAYPFICAKYDSVKRLAESFVDKTITVDGVLNTQTVTQIQIKDTAYTDAAAFKNAVSGVYLVYELATETTEQANPYTNPQNADADGTEEFVCANNVPVGNETVYTVQSDNRVDDLEESVSDLEECCENVQEILPSLEVTGTASGSIASFDDGAQNRPVKELVIDVEPVQDLHGYSNPWVGGAGKNKLDYDSIYNAFRVSDNNFSGEATAVNAASYTLPASLSGTLTFSMDLTVPSGVNYERVAVIVDGTAIFGNNINGGSSGKSSVTFTTGTTTVITTSRGSGTGTLTFKNIQLEVGSSATSWSPYENVCPITGWTGAEVTNKDDMSNPTVTRTYPIPFPSTVYGGNAELVSGEMTEKLAMYNASDLTITRASGDGTITTAWLRGFAAAVSQTVISNRFSRSIGSGAGRIVQTATDIYAVVATSSLSSDTAEGLIQWFVDNPTQLLLELATPTTHQLTPTEVTTLLGNNNIYANTGDVSVEYVRDLNIVINKLLS